MGNCITVDTNNDINVKKEKLNNISNDINTKKDELFDLSKVNCNVKKFPLERYEFVG